MPASCPICQKPTAKAHAPFCSKRCHELDLHKWLSGSYAIPSAEEDMFGEEEESYEHNS